MVEKHGKGRGKENHELTWVYLARISWDSGKREQIKNLAGISKTLNHKRERRISLEEFRKLVYAKLQCLVESFSILLIA